MASLYRGSVWFALGLADFTCDGYLRHARAFSPNDLSTTSPSLARRVAVVTGANSGLGYVVARELWTRGAVVHMVCRNEARGRTAREAIIKEVLDAAASQSAPESASLPSTPPPALDDLRLSLVEMDKPESIGAFIDRAFGGDAAHCHILVNNAGCMVDNAQRTGPDADVPVNFATNTIGTYTMTKLMLPVLERTATAAADATALIPRVITVSSGGGLNARLDLSDPMSAATADGMIAYAQQKRQQIELTDHWAITHPCLRFYSMHPGWAQTPGVATSMPRFAKLMASQLRTPEQGADTIVWLAAADRVPVDVPSGSFLLDRAVVKKHLPLGGTQAKEGDVDRLVALCEETLAKLMPSGTQPM